ncbi:endonuclease/exonuclease/phosphatase family protein [Candidatus Enterococcus ferrettii]|uniref:Maltose 6'-phosphate phosphatase n=1 Tax=Candidatus Enterococcus ferrettii TaxID=2815324 RepID=A0ABV0ERA4_9ENTE|nr:endonuclease/exonuclease/phosphatase family protein [Enterococcus sp. 665A]MBO1342106.1 endonuclease/exonuclease/phosphatase family protein [Enterococcus sp. 665A]
MKVLTLNTHSYMEENVEQQIEVLAQAILNNGYQLVGLQEVNQRRDSTEAVLDGYFQSVKNQKAVKKDNFMLLLIQRLKELGCHYYWSWVYNHIGYDIYHEGVGLLSKSPLTSYALTVSENTDPKDYRTRNVLICCTKYQERNFVVVNGHFSWWLSSSEGFAYEWKTLEKKLVNWLSFPILVMGDFNNSDNRSNQGYQLVKDSSFRFLDSYEEAEIRQGRGTVEKAIDGWQDNQKSIRIDYIFSQAQLKAQTYRTLFNGKQLPQISDHLGIEVDFNWS